MDQPHTEEIRLSKYLAECGICSRRKAEELITAGKVKVNDANVTDVRAKVVPGRDIVIARRRKVMPPPKGVMILHKPTGVMSTLEDPEGRPTVADYLTKKTKSYFPVGRLDWDTSGLVVLTNDGELANHLAHPRFEFERIYEVKVKGRIPDWVLERIERGVKLQDGFVKAQVKVLDDGQRHTWLQTTVVEGRNRLVRRLFEAVRHPVLKLKRVRFGPFHLGRLKIGEVHILNESEYARMRAKVLGTPAKEPPPRRVRRPTVRK